MLQDIIFLLAAMRKHAVDRETRIKELEAEVAARDEQLRRTVARLTEVENELAEQTGDRRSDDWMVRDIDRLRRGTWSSSNALRSRRG